jgi:hypothetical protein
MSDLFPPTIPELIAEVEREIAARERVYPRLVAEGKSTRKKADRQMSLMRAVLANLRAQLAREIEMAVLAKLKAQPEVHVPALEGKVPLILYFGTREDAEGFIAEVKDAMPGMSSYKLP